MYKAQVYSAIAEYFDLEARIYRLERYIETPHICITGDDSLEKEQLSAMKEYRACLLNRLNKEGIAPDEYIDLVDVIYSAIHKEG